MLQGNGYGKVMFDAINRLAVQINGGPVNMLFIEQGSAQWSQAMFDYFSKLGYSPVWLIKDKVFYYLAQ